VKKQV